MKVNARKIKVLRTSNGWTQQHLADACAISLRTVQWVERYGNASRETVASLASVFEMNQTALIVEEQQVELVNDKNVVMISVQSQSLIIAALIGTYIGALIMYIAG